MLQTSTRLMMMCLVGSIGAACGEADDRPGGDGDSGGEADAGERADAAPAPSCEPSEQVGELPIAWSADFRLYPNRVVFDPDGTLVVSLAQEPTRCVRLARFAADGTELWRHGYDPSPVPAENYKPCPSAWNAIAIGPDGAIVTVSNDVAFPDQAGPTDIVVRKHDADGNALWTYHNQNAPDGFEGSDGATAVAVAPDGSVLAAGSHASRAWVARLSPDGVAEWAWTGPGKTASDVAVSADGTAFVSVDTGEIEVEHRVVRLDPDGTATTIAELRLAGRPGLKLATTSDGGLVFVERAATPLLRKIDAGGDLVWEQPMPFMADEECRPIDLRGYSYGTGLDDDGTIHVVVEGWRDTSPDPPNQEPWDVGSRVFARFSGDGTYLGSHMRGYHVIDDMTVSPDGAIAVSSFKDVDVTPPLDTLASGRAR